MEKRKFDLWSLARILGLALLSAVIILPLLIMIFGAFKDDISASRFTIAPPSQWHFENFSFVFEYGGIPQAFVNSIFLSASVVLGTVLISTMAGFVIQRRSGKLSSFSYVYFLGGLIVPLQIVTTYAVLKTLGIMGTFMGVICVYIALNIPFSIFLYTGFMRGIPLEMDEAAIIDGCGTLSLFCKIIFPMLKPTIATNTVIVTMSVWNDFQIPLYFLNSSTKWTLPLTIYNFYGQYFSNWNYVFANMIITVVPMVILYLFMQKYIVAGVSQGAVKG